MYLPTANWMNRTPQLQLAVDVLTIDEALSAVEKVHASVDIIEVGTPLVIECGLKPVELLKAEYPDKQVLADLKVMDAGHIEASSGFGWGADIVTVLGLADEATIRGAVDAAEDRGRVMADLIQVPDPARRAKELLEMGVHLLCLHTAYDRRDEGVDPLVELHAVRPEVDLPLGIAGGLKLENTADVVRGGADIVVVGGAIQNAGDPARMAADIKDAMMGAA